MKRNRIRLGELCSLVKGTSPISKTPPGQYPLVTTGETHKTANTFQLDCEAVCIPLISSTGHGHASLKRIHYQAGKFALGNLLAAAIVKDHAVLSAKFLARYLMFAKDRLIVPLMTGAANMSISIDRLATVPVEFPSLPEQERIVALMTEIDELLDLRAQADRRAADLISSTFYDMFGRHITTPPVLISIEKITLPQGWRWSLLTDVARLATGHTPSRRIPEYWNGGEIPWISLTDIRAIDGRVAQTTSQSVTEAGIEHSSAVKLPKGTVCFSRTASIGFVTIMGRDMCTSQDFVNWVCGEELDPYYLTGALMYAREHLRSLASGSTHKTIYIPTVEQFRVLAPPLPLQKEFAQRFKEVRALEAEQAKSRKKLDGLFESMQHRAFAGKL